MCLPILILLPTSLFILSLWIVPEHQLWVLCFIHWTCTGHLFHIWQYTCFNAVLSDHPTLAVSHRVQKSVVVFIYNWCIYFNWRIISLQYCGFFFCHTSTWISDRYTCVPTSWTTPRPLPTLFLLVVPEHQFWVPCFMHRTCTGHLFHIWWYTCFNAILSHLPTLAFSHRV